MRLIALGFLGGDVVCQSLSVLPPESSASLLLIALILALPVLLLLPRYRFFTSLAIGFFYSLIVAQNMLADQLPPALEGLDFRVTGTVASVPREYPGHTSFQFQVSEYSDLSSGNRTSTQISVPEDHIVTQYSLAGQKLLLNWYDVKARPLAGDQWKLRVRLKRPNGYSNPGGFDFERWMFQRGIVAKGYVVTNKGIKENEKLAIDTGIWHRINRLRQRLYNQINALLAPDSNRQAGLISALVVGERQGLDKEQWETLSNTGTNHLMAISGLHIGLVAGLVFMAGRRIWLLYPRAALYIPAPKAAAVVALLAATGYAALAGFSVPTQRALIMVLVVMVALWCDRTFLPSQILSVALLLVLLYDPMAVLDAGFWLSFAAVLVIYYGMAGRLANRHWWWKWGRVQWIIATGLGPILYFVFQKVPLVAPLANAIAVPLVSFVTVPVSLAGAVSILFFPWLASPLLVIAHWSLDVLWPLLSWLASLDSLLVQARKPPLWTLFPAALGMILLLAPAGTPGRWLGAIWLAPMIFINQPDLADKSFSVTMLDVGQGLAVVIQTREHVLVYDTGPRFGENFDAGRFALVPYLEQAGINTVHTLILSHDDIDHTGGAASILQSVAVEKILVAPGVDVGRPVELCSEGVDWTWNGVHFQILHPNLHSLAADDNNRSCVVRITSENGSVLITGDIEKAVESQLLTDIVPDAKAGTFSTLSADILIVPHHGSNSSSSERFVQQVSPKFALVAAGYRNRYGLPKKQVTDRYEAIGARILSTQNSGAIQLFVTDSDHISVNEHRKQVRRYWSRGTP